MSATEKTSAATKAFGVTSGAGRDFLCVEEVSVTLKTDGHKVGVLVVKTESNEQNKERQSK